MCSWFSLQKQMSVFVCKCWSRAGRRELCVSRRCHRQRVELFTNSSCCFALCAVSTRLSSADVSSSVVMCQVLKQDTCRYVLCSDLLATLSQSWPQVLLGLTTSQPCVWNGRRPQTLCDEGLCDGGEVRVSVASGYGRLYPDDGKTVAKVHLQRVSKRRAY
jgi:hypothetical protein